ncbi:MAG: DMT family transporter, partial [Alphaproteobacteria bacterium]
MQSPAAAKAGLPPIVRAAALCVVACAFFAGANALAKAAGSVLPGPPLPPAQLTAARFLFAFLALSPFLLRRGPSVFRTSIPFRHLQRVLLGAGGVTCMFSAVQEMRLGDVIAVAWAAPLFTLLFAALFLGERVGRARWAAAAVGFAGVVVLMRPTAAAFEPMALVAALAAVCTGAEVVIIRILATRDSALTVLAINNLVGAALACTAAAFVFVMPSWAQTIALVGVGVVMVAGQAIFLRALAIAEASAVAPFYYATIAWAALIGVVAFGEPLGWP